MGISLSNSNPIQFPSVILDDEFESLEENPTQPIAPSPPTPVVQSFPLVEEPPCIRPMVPSKISYSDWSIIRFNRRYMNT